jgi:hypothetical protein
LDSRQHMNDNHDRLIRFSPFRLPTGEFDESRAIAHLADNLIPMMRQKFEREKGREWLETELAEGLREGQLDLAVYAVRMAREGDEICDAALRRVAAELQTPLLQRRELAPGHLQIISYLQDITLTAEHKRRPRGRPWTENVVRDILILLFVGEACRLFGLHPTRARDSRRAKRDPSGVSLITAALAHCGLHLEEASVQKYIWHGSLANRLRARGIIAL